MLVRRRTEKNENNFNNRISKSKSKIKSKSIDKSNKKCYHCGKLGHFKLDCFEWKEKLNDQNNGELNNFVVGFELDSLLVMIVSNEEVDKDWILDSGYTFHMCHNRSWFNNYKEVEPMKVYMSNNNS